MGLEKLLVADMELAYGQETQGKDKQLLSSIGSRKDGALCGMLEIVYMFV